MKIEIIINGKSRNADVDAGTRLIDVLRNDFRLLSVKEGCGAGECGACTVLLDGEATRACSLPVEAVAGRAVTTIEGIDENPVGRQVVEAWVEAQAPQCGYCQSGQVMAATALLTTTPKPSREDIEAAMTNICRCGTYNAIARAIAIAGERL